MIGYLNLINKLYVDLKTEIEIQLSNSDVNISIDDLFYSSILELKKLPIKKYIEYNNLCDEIDEENIFKILELKFYAENLEMFDENVESDQIEKFIMKLNKEINVILNINNSYISLGDKSNNKIISWSFQKDSDSRIKFYKEIIKKHNTLLNEKEIDLFDNKSICIYYDSEIINNILMDLLFYVCKKLYIKHYNRLVNNVSNKSLGISSEKLYIDIAYYKNNKQKIKVEQYNGDKNINILHISDMHINKNTNDISKKFLSEFGLEIYDIKGNKQRFNEKIEIIIITGDIIQAGKSSKEMLDNYLNAYEQVQIIAMEILGNLWESRILVIPGNHDYGMINDLKINFTDRSYNNVEVTKDSKEFEKFVFFHLIFDNITMNETLNRLEKAEKEIVNYKLQIGKNNYLNFYLFNTSSTANTIRSNKVSLNIPNNNLKVDATEQVFLLMHHTPLYEINYYRDIFVSYCEEEYYKFILGVEKDDYKLILKILEEKKEKDFEEIKRKKESNNENLKVLLKNLKFEYKNILDNNESVEGQKDKEAVKSKLKINEKAIEKIIDELINRNENLVNALETFLNGPMNEIKLNDMINILSYFDMSKRDKEQYDNAINKLRENFTKYIILGGHQHEQKFKIDNDYTIIEVGKTFNNEKIYYSIISCDMHSSNSFYSSVLLKNKEDLMIESE